MAESAGIMSGAFFVSKGDLLKWLNEFFHAGYSKVEECASGAIHCQILDSIYPGKVKLEKVNFNAKFDYEFTNNFKVLQAVFAEQGIKKYVDVDKLVKAKYQDNLEFLQWIKNFWDSKYNGEPYDAAGRKEAAMKAYAKGRKFPAAAGSAAPAPKATPSAGAAAGSKIGAVKAAPAAKPAAAESKRPAPAAAKPTSAKPAAASSGADEAKVAELNAKLTKLRLTIEGLEKERNFYFGKLREVEIMCQTEPEVDAATKSKVLEVLYATDNEDFEAPADGAAATEEAPAEEAPADEYQEAAPEEENADETF